MKRMNYWFGVMLLAAMLLSACAPAAPAEDKMMEAQAKEDKAAPDSSKDMTDPASGDSQAEMSEPDEKEAKTDEMQKGESEELTEEPKDDEMSETDDTETKSDDTMMEAPAWFSAEMTNVRTGETFTIQDYKGKVVLVENMAIWCSNCLRQQKQVKELKVLLGERDDFVSLGLDIDPFEDTDSLKSYTEQNGFDWTYAVLPADVAREIGNLYGAQYLNPPSTPMFIIDRSGQVHLLPFGIKDAQSLLEALQPFLDEGM